MHREWGFATARALAICAALSACRCGKAKGPEPKSAEVSDLDARAELYVSLRVAESDLVEVNDDHGLKNQVVGLHRIAPSGQPSASEPWCTATPLTRDIVLTSSHCLAQRIPLMIPGHGVVEIDDRARACDGGPCSEAPREPGANPLEFSRRDVGTAVIRRTSAAALTPGGARLVEAIPTGELPPLYLVSARRPRPLLVCRATLVVHGVGGGDGQIERGDSGSPLFVVEASPSGVTRSVVGVVSRRTSLGDAWFFASLRGPLPWPKDAGVPRPTLSRRAFARTNDPRCPRR